ncbi:MAG: NPCBM/NEW2 domain-containing protein [Verrucomicrobiales bacterium]|nr:NPCBM/NEW2 domain-containing protein [Verrucomicrobiales bacterium]
MTQKLRSILATAVASFTLPLIGQAESLPPLKDGKSPQTVEEAWAGFDPKAEPLDIEIIKEWEEDGVVIRAVRYRIGIFKGQKSWMGALYGFPKGAKDLPGIVQIHGGGGMANSQFCIDNAKRGYATISLSWRADERYLKVYELPETAQTDWAAVEGRQVKESRGIEPSDDKRYDPVPSARNSGYFLRALAARRALTFLEEQPEVDGSRLGVDGFSMGGVITLMTAAMDDRVKAAVPWWAPPLDLDGELKSHTASPNAFAELIKGPMLFMAPSNDFHGKVEDVAWMINHIPSDEVRISRAIHLNHKNDAQSMAARELWLDSKLKDGHSFPGQPDLQVDLNTEDGRPKILVQPDSSMPTAYVDIFYTRDAKQSEYATNRTRYWQYAKPKQEGEKFSASLDLFDIDEPLWVFANVHYELKDSGAARALTLASDTFTVTTRLIMLSTEDLAKAGIKKNSTTSSVIEPFDSDWEKEWIVTDRRWTSWKLNHQRVPMPEYGKLVLEVQSDESNHLTVEVGDYRGVFPLKGDEHSQKIEIDPFELKEKKTKASLLSWIALPRPMITLATSRGKPEPSFKKLTWEMISKAEFLSKRPFQLGEAEKTDGKVMLSFEQADFVNGRHDPDGNSVKVDDSIVGIDVKNGLQVHSQGVSEVTYFLNGKFSTFSATLIPCYQASAVFEVHADGKKVFESSIFRGKTPPKDIEVDVTSTQMLKLVISEGGNGWGGDWVMWGKASLQ